MNNEAHQIAGYAGAIYEFYIESYQPNIHIIYGLWWVPVSSEWINGNFTGIV